MLIANTGGDRLIDWVGEYNSYFTPFGPYGEPTVIRRPYNGIYDFLLDLGRASGLVDHERPPQPHRLHHRLAPLGSVVGSPSASAPVMSLLAVMM